MEVYGPLCAGLARSLPCWACQAAKEAAAKLAAAQEANSL